MSGRSPSLTWKIVFAAGLVLRPFLIVPMAPSGPLAGSDLLPVGLALLIAFHVLLAAGVFVERLAAPAIAFGILTALAGVVLAAVGVWLGLPMPWSLALVGCNAVLAVVGIKAWEDLEAANRS